MALQPHFTALTAAISHFSSAVSSARVLTKSVKIDQPEGIPDPGIPERLFVKFAHRRSFAFSCRASRLSLKQGTENRGIGLGNGERGTRNGGIFKMGNL